MSKGKNYETGMRITFDPRAKSVAVAFRGRVTVLAGPFDSETAAVAAGEAFCVKQGWVKQPVTESGTSLLAHRKTPR